MERDPHENPFEQMTEEELRGLKIAAAASQVLRDKTPVCVDVAGVVVEAPPSNPQVSKAALAVIGGKGPGIFAPAVNPEMQGRRPSGVTFAPGDVPKEARGVPIMEQPDDVIVPKATAKSVAEELTKHAVICRDRPDGRKEIEVVYPHRRLAFEGRTWFLALASLKNWLDRPRP